MDKNSPAPVDGESPAKKLLNAKRKYKELPIFRRQEFCGGVIVAQIISSVVVGYVPILFPLSILATIGVVVVCILVLTGPIYMNQLDFKTGELMQWGVGQKIAAIVILVLVTGGLGFLILLWNGAFA